MPDDTTNALEELLVELATDDGPRPELLVRYASGEALSPAERAEVEAALESSPALGDELRLVQGFDFGALARESSGRTQRDERRDRPEQRAPRRARRHAAAWLALPVAAAAALAVALLLRDDERPLPGSQVAGSAPVEPAPIPPPPGEPRPGTGEGGDRAPAPSPGAEPPRATPPRQPGTAPGPATELPPGPEPGPEPPGGPGSRPDAQPILVAVVLPDYEAPPDASFRRRTRSVLRSTGSARPPLLTLLSPEHVARTASPRPVLYWHTDREIAGGELKFTLVNEDEAEPLASLELDLPVDRGVHAIDLDALDVTIPAGQELRWSVAWAEAPRAAPSAFATAWIWRRDEPLSRGSEPGADAAAYARAGLWHDALEQIISLQTRASGSADVAEAYAHLLRQAGLEELLAP